MSNRTFENVLADRPFRGLSGGLRADAGEGTRILADLQKAFAAFKEEQDKHIADLRKGQEDVVRAEKVERINASLGDLQSAMDEINQRMANIANGGVGGGGRLADAAYTEAFSAFIRRNEINASLSKGAPADGGYLTPIEWDRTITDRLKQISAMRRLARVITISTAGFSKLFNNHGTGSGWVGETAARPETASPTLSTLDYKPGEIYAHVYATQGLLDDALIDLENWIAAEVELEFSKQEGLAFVSGSGANDRPKGILTYVTGGANAAVHPWGAIQTVNSGAASALTSDGLIDLVYALPSEYSARAAYVMNRASHGLVRKLKDAQGQYLWQPSVAAGQPPTLLGFPVEEMADMPAVAAGAKPIVFGDFQGGYLIVDRFGTRILRDPYSAKPNVTFYTTKRVGGGLLDPDRFKAQNISV